MKKLFDILALKFEKKPELSQGIYIYPFEHPNPTQVKTETHPAEKTHEGVYNGAIDFMLEVGTPVLAAADGVIVVPYHCGSIEYGNNPDFAPKANLVTIYHPDTGEFTQYIHLGPDLIVKEGETVLQGQPIGKTALSGYMGGKHPEHLHFFVFKGADNESGFIGLTPKFKK